MKKLVRRCLVSGGTLVLLLALGELWARLAEPGPFSIVDRSPFVLDEELDFAHRPGFRGRWEDTWYEIDSRGLRGPELPDAGDGALFRVLALGDSCTVGKGVLERESWPRVLEHALEAEFQHGLRPSVANLGVVGYSGRQYRATLERTGLALEPDLVIVGYNLNDFPNSIEAVDQLVFHERKLRTAIPVWLRDALSRTALYRFARATYYEWGLRDDWFRVREVAAGLAESVQDPAVLEREREHLAGIVELSRQAGARVLVLLFPYESQVYVDTYDTRPVAGLARICAELEVPFVDLALVLRRAAAEQRIDRGLFLRGDRYHPSPLGYRIVAEAVLAELSAQGWISRPSD